MCLMLVAPNKGAVPRDYLQNAFDHNSDGWGIMYALDGRVICLKEKSGIKRFYKAWDACLDGVNIAAHFRFGTSGPKNATACHPFPVLEKSKGDPFDLYMMHNGVLRHLHGDSKASDTMQLVARMRSQLLRYPGLLRDRVWREDQEEILGNPNKIVFLEGNGRWTYLNYDQGKRHESGVWYSNEYSLCKVYSGHGKGKAASRVADDDYSEYYGAWAASNVTRYDSGKLIPSPATQESADFVKRFKAMMGDKSEMTWALQLIGPPDKREKVYWKKTLMGWVRMAQNPDTGAFYRHYKQEGEKVGCDIATVLPRDCVTFRPKDEKKFERGDRMRWTTNNAGEHEAIPVESSLYSDTEARAAVSSHVLLDVKDVAQVANDCGAGGGSIVARMATLETSNSVEQICTRDGVTVCDSFCDGRAGCRVMAQEDMEEERERQYTEQLFSPANIREMSEADLCDAIQDYPEEAAIALGAAYNCRWAFEEEKVTA